MEHAMEYKIRKRLVMARLYHIPIALYLYDAEGRRVAKDLATADARAALDASLLNSPFAYRQWEGNHPNPALTNGQAAQVCMITSRTKKRTVNKAALGEIPSP
jgi:hypothetical protein